MSMRARACTTWHSVLACTHDPTLDMHETQEAPGATPEDRGYPLLKVW